METSFSSFGSWNCPFHTIPETSRRFLCTEGSKQPRLHPWRRFFGGRFWMVSASWLSSLRLLGFGGPWFFPVVSPKQSGKRCFFSVWKWRESWSEVSFRVFSRCLAGSEENQMELKRFFMRFSLTKEAKVGQEDWITCFTIKQGLCGALTVGRSRFGKTMPRGPRKNCRKEFLTPLFKFAKMVKDKQTF